MYRREHPLADFTIQWDAEDDPRGNVQHIARHGVTMAEVEDVLGDPDDSGTISDSGGRPITFGRTRDGRCLAIVWETASEDPATIYPITAYPVRPRSGS